MFSNLVTALLLTTMVFANPLHPNMKVPETRIRGGENTVIEIHPYQVSIGVVGTHECGGSIISENLVITAGHCMIYQFKYLTVRAGATFRDKNGSIHHVESYVRHEDYYENDYNIPVNDVAIVKVKEPFIFDNTRQPIKLSTEEFQPGTIAVVTGWGNTGEGYLADQLQSLAVPLISKQACNFAIEEFGGISEGQICTNYEGEGKKDACNGDSGGPLVVDGKLAGIVSYGDSCDLLEYPGVYTEVAYFHQWITKKIDLLSTQ